jgi:hypothetical protein
MRVDDEQVGVTAYGTGGFFPPSRLARALARDLLRALGRIATLEAEAEDLLEAAQPGTVFAMEERCDLCGKGFREERGEWRGRACPLNHDDATLAARLAKMAEGGA